MAFSDFLLTEGIEPKKPLGAIRKKKVVKNRGMINQKNLDQIEFDTTSGNNVKVQIQIRDGVGDVVFYVNDTLDDLGGRKDGSVDPEIMGGVLWIVDVYADRLELNGLTFSAWAGKGDTKVVRGLDIEKPREAALKGLREYMADVREYKANVIPPTPSRIALAKKLGREPTVVYDVNVGKLLRILEELVGEVENRDVARLYDFEEEIHLSRSTGGGLPDDLMNMEPYNKLEDLIPGGIEVLKLVKQYNVARMSHSEEGASVTRNRRQDLYKRLIDKFFSDKWNIKQDRNQFELTRKGVVESVVVERKSLDDKSVYIQKWAEEALELLRSGNYILCDGLKMAFGKMYGVKCVGKYGEWGFRNVYYFGRVDGLGEWDSARAQGRADIVDAPGMQGRESCVYVSSDTIYDELHAVKDKFDFDGFSIPVGQLEDYDAGGMIYALGEHEKRILYHELSHVYDVWKRGTVGLGKAGEHRWSSRPEELEAELNLVYNSILTDLDSYKSAGEFEAKYPLTKDGLRQMSEDYGSQIWAFMGWADNNPGKVKIEYKKIIRRLVDLRGQIVAKLKEREGVTENVTEDVVELPKKPAASYSVEQLMFAMFDESFRDYGQYYIPLLSRVIKKIFGDIQGYGWHLTSRANLERLKAIQGTNKSISTLHRKDIPRVMDKGVTTKADIAVLVKGNVLLKYDINAWTVVDENGNRWVPVVSNKTGKSIGADVESIKQAYVAKLQELAGELRVGSWKEVHDKYGSLSGEQKKKLLERFVSSMEEFVVENADNIKDNIYGAIDVSEKAMDEVETGFNEIVISDFEIVKVVPIETFKESRKFSDLMVEMPAWNDASKSLSDEIGDATLQDVLDAKTDSGFMTVDQFEFGDYVCWVMKRHREKAICCVVGHENKHIGEFDWYLNPFGWTTESAVVHPEYQGRGIAFYVYKYVIENHMKTLYSDNHLTGEVGKGSFDVWAKLGRVFPYKYVYDSIEDIAEEVDGFTRDMMGDEDKLFVVSTEDILEDA
jgi:GNAT superfamily N-acetyltransferase